MPGIAFSWIKNYHLGDLSIGKSVQQTQDGGYIVTGGMTVKFEDFADIFLLKTDADGNSLWVKTYGGELNDEARCVRQTTDGGYVMTGYADGDAYPDPGKRLLLLKTDSLGDTMWVQKWGGMSVGNWVEQTSDGGYIITGDCNGAYLWLIKTDENGDREWDLKFDDGLSEVGYCVKELSEGGYIVAANIGLMRVTEDGDTLWIKPWPCKSVAQTTDGNYIIVGQVWTPPIDIRLRKIGSEGDTLWTRTWGGGSTDDACYVQQLTDGGFMIIGETESFGAGKTDVWLLKTDSLGDTLWTKTFGGEYWEEAYSGQQTLDGGYIITGHLGALYPNNDVLLIKTDSTGDAGIDEKLHIIQHPDWQIISAIGPYVTLRYENRPEGFYAQVFDASGRRVDEIASTSQSGTITWGEGQMPGVYFIKPKGEDGTARVVIVR